MPAAGLSFCFRFLETVQIRVSQSSLRGLIREMVKMYACHARSRNSRYIDPAVGPRCGSCVKHILGSWSCGRNGQLINPGPTAVVVFLRITNRITNRVTNGESATLGMEAPTSSSCRNDGECI